MLKISISKNFDLSKDAEKIRIAGRRGLARGLLFETTEIKVRTRSGVDVRGSAFKPYSPAYAKRRQKAGRGTTPDLTFTGAMLGSIKSEVKETPEGIEGSIFFSSPNEQKKVEGNSRYREFFGLSEEQKTRIENIVNNEIKGAL